MSFLVTLIEILTWILHNSYIFWLLTPIVIVLLSLPLLSFISMYLTALFVSIHRNKLVRRFREVIFRDHDYLEAIRDMVCTLWDAHGLIWHGYEIKGLQHIPSSGPALLLYYHGALPMDIYYLIAKVQLLSRRSIHCVVDSFLYSIPGLKNLLEVFHCTQGEASFCVRTLQEGHLLSLAPGGVFEAQFSRHKDYEIEWRRREGFARIAKKTSVPIIPIFTRNIRESIRIVPFYHTFFRNIYETLRIPLLPGIGIFPVKLVTVVGEPIVYDAEKDSVSEIRDKCYKALRTLIDEEQPLPGSILRALWERFTY